MLTELCSKISKKEARGFDQALLEYLADYDCWPEYMWSEIETDINTYTITIIIKCGPELPKDRQTLVYCTGELNSYTREPDDTH